MNSNVPLNFITTQVVKDTYLTEKKQMGDKQKHLSPYMESRFMVLESEILETDRQNLDIVKNVIQRLQTAFKRLPDPNVNISGDGSVSFGWTGVGTMPQFACNIFEDDLVIFTKADDKPQRIKLTLPVLDSLTDNILNRFTTLGLEFKLL